MINPEQLHQFNELDKMAPRLRERFSALTQAHKIFQGAAALRTMSVSDLLDDDSIDATFHGVRIKFKLLLTFGCDHRPRGRVVCLHCHCTHGKPMQDSIGAFTFGPDGITDLDPDIEGNVPRMDADPSAIVLRYLEAALLANKSL